MSQQAQDYMAVEEDPEAGADSCDMLDAREQLTAALKPQPGAFKGQVGSPCQYWAYRTAVKYILKKLGVIVGCWRCTSWVSRYLIDNCSSSQVSASTVV